MRAGYKRFLFGVGAGGASLALSYVLRVSIGTPFLPELAVNALVSHTPGTVESVLVVNLQSLAKYSAFTVAIAVNLMLYGIVAFFITRIRQKGSYADRIPLYSLIAYALTLALSLVFLAITRVLSAPQPLPNVLLGLLPSQFLYGAVLSAEEKLYPIQTAVICVPLEPPATPMRKKGKVKFDRRRRLIIQGGAAAVVAGVLLYYGLDLLFPKTPPATSPSGAIASLYSQEVTTNDNFYVVDVDIIPPSVDQNSWSLQVTGLVSSPTTFTYSQLTSMTQQEQYNTLECVSNTVGGDLISTAKWTGVRISDILQAVGAQSSATYVIFRAVDGYSVGVPIGSAMLDGAILAYQMNGEPLPQQHGFPLRAIIPGLYGMMNCKWITSMEVSAETYQGYWQQEGWENDAHYNTMSSIVTPGASQVDDRFGIESPINVPLGIVPVAGIAFAGDRGIDKVEVSSDGGQTWTQATLQDPLSGYTWVFWTAEWNPPAVGSYQLMVRATDGTGAVQTAVMSGPFPDGATGYHVVDVGVVSG